MQDGFAPVATLEKAGWAPDEYRAVVKHIAASEHGLVPEEELRGVAGGGDALRGREVLLALLKARLLSRRRISTLARDLVGLPFERGSEVLGLATPAHLVAVRESVSAATTAGTRQRTVLGGSRCRFGSSVRTPTAEQRGLNDCQPEH